MTATRTSIIAILSAAVCLAAIPPARALIELAHDDEPNNAPHQAVDLSVPSGKDTVRVIGSLEGQDQDAYRLVIDEDRAGTRFDLQLTGRGGALTRLDIFDFTDLADGRGRIPAELTERPTTVFSLSTSDGTRPVRADRLLLAPGVYVFGVSHSGGEGGYTFDLGEHDSHSVTVLETAEDNKPPTPIRTRGRTAAFWTGGETPFEFEIDAPAEGEPETSYWDLTFQAPAGRDAVLRLIAPDGESLLEIEDGNGLPVVRRGLGLAAGIYRMVSDSDPASVQMLTLEPASAPVSDNREVEPNDRLPNAIGFGQDLSGSFEKDDRDWLTFDVGAEQAARKIDLELATDAGAGPELCIQNEAIGLNHCKRGDGQGVVRLVDLGLAEGTYLLRMHARSSDSAEWRLSWTDQGEVRPGEEIEPNDDIPQASTLHERGFGRGRFVGRERDYWRFSVEGEPQLWRLQLQGDNLHEMILYDARGQQVMRVRPGAAPRGRLDNLFLMPGEYGVKVEGTDSDYTVRLLPLGPPPPGMEMEPNDDYHNAMRLQFGQDHTGTLSETDDVDRFRFLLLGYERVRIRVQPPVDGAIRGMIQVGDEAVTISDIRQGNEPGKPLDWDLFLPPGDYSLMLDPGQASDAEYTVRAERGDWLETPSDREPNNSRATASPLPPDGQVTGNVGVTAAGEDWYAIGPLEQAGRVEIPRRSGIRTELFGEDDPGQDLFQWDAEAKLSHADLTAGSKYWLQIEGNADYAFDLSGLLPESQLTSTAPPTVVIELPEAPVQAWSRWRQRVDGRLVVTSPAPEATTVELQTHLTDQRWTLELEADRVEVGPGASVEVPFSISIPPDAVDRRAVRLSVAAGPAARPGRAMAELHADSNAALVNPSDHWSVPEPLSGGFNAAATRFGAEPVASPGVSDKAFAEMHRLFDGLTTVGRWTEFKIPFPRDGELAAGQPTVRLAGTEPVPVQGFLLNPVAALSPVSFLGDFAIELSLDGESFEWVLTDTLAPLAEEQAFVLDQPVAARYARLIPLTAPFSDASDHGIRIGEFKVVAESGWRPDDESIDVASSSMGGHAVWAEPWLRGSAADSSMLDDNGEATALVVRRTDRVELVVGFEHSRAARIERIALFPVPDTPEIQRPERVVVFTATDSPVGPWTEVGSFDVTDGPARHEFAQPVWARYVRLVMTAREGAQRLQLPDRIAIHEVNDGSTPSILGEWGHYSQVGPFEAQSPPEFQGMTGVASNRDRASARALDPGESAPGRALLDQYASWYRLRVPEGQNQLVLTMRGVPTLEAAPRLFDATDQPVELYPISSQSNTQRWQAIVEPGGEYVLEAYEPPRSVIFSWDTSGSVARYLPIISSALFSYAETIVPDRDEVNLLPFGHSRPLLEDWVGHPYPLRRLLAAYPQDTSSSSAEATLAAAARAMIGRPGKKAVLLLTDARTSTSADLWPALQEGRPQVFSMRLSGEGAFGGSEATAQDLMQDWARVRGGEYQYVASVALLELAFDRAVARLKRPVQFEVSVDYDQVDDPEPARISVISGEKGIDAGSRGAVEIILDASGSMLKRMDGERRIEIAKAAIRRTVEQTMPDGLPLALRVYGHREAGVCRTDLEVPLAPLDKASFLDQVSAIQAINLAKTPIAESLEAVASDLAAAEGRRLVILLTDGEETCDGDPAAAIQALSEAGFDVTVNIVGFAIDDENLKRDFAEWAELGGGSYLDAGEAEALGDALEKSLSVPFVVIDADGDEVARGQVDGDPVEVPAGRYSVRVDFATPRVERDVVLAPGDSRDIEFD